MKNCLSAFLLVLFLFPAFSHAQLRKSIDRTTDVLMFAPAVTGLIRSLVIKDYKGAKQLVFSGATGIAATYLLKYTVRKERPDHSDSHAFPSNHAAIAFMGSTFLQKRYGWKWGVPAYVLSAYVCWGRTYARQHDWWDVLGGAAIGTASSFIFTRPYAQKHNLALAPALLAGRYPGIYVSFTL